MNYFPGNVVDHNLLFALDFPFLSLGSRAHFIRLVTFPDCHCVPAWGRLDVEILQSVRFTLLVSHNQGPQSVSHCDNPRDGLDTFEVAGTKFLSIEVKFVRPKEADF